MIFAQPSSHTLLSVEKKDSHTSAHLDEFDDKQLMYLQVFCAIAEVRHLELIDRGANSCPKFFS
jgi:hypothetical protein